jgi:CRP-like cAMP-binding protein
VAYAYEKLLAVGDLFTVAAAFGNVHGVYKPGNVELRPDILHNSQLHIQDKFKTAEKPVYFVFHGGSGSPQNQIREAIGYGAIKMNIDTDKGDSLTFTGVSRGGWFGEGTALKREPYRYNVQTLRASVVAGLPIANFHELLSESIGFNRFIMNQLNERLGQFIAAREIDRLNSPDVRVARSLAALFNPVLFPGVGEVLQITQQELAYLVGLSRQRVNMALQRLVAEGWISVAYGGVRVLNLQALRSHTLGAP